MSWFEDSNIKKSYIVQTVSDVGIFSACTQIYLTNILPCTGNTINIAGNLGVSGNISGTTYYGDGSQLSGIVTTDNFVTGGVYSASSETLYFTGTTGFTPFSVDVSALLDNTNNYVTGGTYNPSTDTVTLTRNDDVNISITGISDTFTTGGTYNESTELITFIKNDGSSYTVDLAALVSGTTNSYTTGATLNGNIIEFANSVLGLNYYNVDLTPIVSGKVETSLFNTYTADTQTTLNSKLDTASFNTYSGSVETQLSNKTDNTNFTSHTGDTTIHFTKGSINLSDLGSSAHTHSISEVINLQTELDGKVETTLFNTYTGDTETALNGKLDITTFNTYSGSVQTELDSKVESASNVGGANEVFSGKSGTDLQFRTISGGSNTTITTVGGIIKVDSTASGDNTFVTGGTLSGSDLILEKNNDVDVNPVDLSGLVSGKVETTLFNTYTGDTETTLNSKTDNTDFASHTGDTTIHYTKGSINLSDLGSSAHTHSISEVINLQTELDSKTNTSLFNTHTGDTNNPHQTSFSNLTSTAHTHSISDVINLQTELDSKLAITTFNSYTGSVVDVFVSSGNADAGTQQLSFTNTTGGTFNVTNSAALFSDNDVNVTGGTYNPSTGCITFTTNSGTTFDVCGFATGLTDTFVTGGTLSGNDLILERNNGIDVSGIDLSGLVSGKLDITTFNTYTGDTQTVLNSKTDNTDFTSHTGDTTIHFTKGSINLSDLGSSAHTHTLSEITDFNSYSGSVQTQINNKVETTLFNTYTADTQTTLNGKIETASNVGGGEGLFSGKSGTDLKFKTLTSTGTTVTITDGGDTINLESAAGSNFYVTGFTYNDANTLTISRNGGLGDLSATINTLTGLTIDGVLSASTYTGITLTSLDDVTSNIPSTPDNTYQGRLLYFDATDNQWLTGEEYVSTGNVTIWAKKGSAGTIDKGCPVYITGFDNDIHEVELANASTGSTMPVIGFTAEDFDNAGVYPLITFGKLSGIDTTSATTVVNPFGETWEVNDVLYMAKTDGGLTKFRPTGSDTRIQRIAKVLNVGTTNGQIFIFNTARTAGLPNLTTGYLWVGNGDDLPQEVIRTDVGITTTGFTYNDNNTFTITDDNGGSLSSTFNQVSGLTINGDLDVTGDTTLNTLTATSITSNSAIDVFNGHINLRDNSFFLQGRTVADVNVSLIGVDNQDRVFVGNAGYDTYIDSDTIVDGSLTATTLNITTIGGTTPVTNLGIDGSGNVVSGTTGESNTASNVGGGEGLFAQKNVDDLEFKSLTSTGGTVTISSNATTVNVESTGGGTSYWEETASAIKLDTGETTRDIVEINTGAAVTYGGNFSQGNLVVGDGHTFGGSSNTVRRSFIGGSSCTVGTTDSYEKSIGFGQSLNIQGDEDAVFGASNTVVGNRNFTANNGNSIYGTSNANLGASNVIGNVSSVNSNTVTIGQSLTARGDNQVLIGQSVSTANSTVKGIYFGMGDSRPSAGFFQDALLGVGLNFAIGGNQTMRSIGVIQNGSGKGIFYLNNYTGGTISEPTVDIGDSVAMWAKKRSDDVVGLLVKDESGEKSWIGGRIGVGIIDPTEALEVSGNTVISGTLNVGSVGGTTPVTNLGVDSSGNVVSGSTISNTPVVSTYKIDSNADITLYSDSEISITWDVSQTDIDMEILTDPTTSQVHITKRNSNGAITAFDLVNADGISQIEASMGNDDRVDLNVFAPSDSAYPHYRISITRSNSLTYTNTPFLVIVEKWSSYS